MAKGFDVLVVGAGPAGLMAAIHAVGAGVAVLEANPVAGRKLLITGGGRCNLTHAGRVSEVLEAFRPKDRFLRHAFHEWPPSKVIEFFEQRGLKTRIEPDGCVFPASDQAIGVREVLLQEVHSLGVTVFYDRKVLEILRDGAGFTVHTTQDSIHADKVILATGGLSYPATGSTGDGLGFARALGHTLVPPKPALVPLVIGEQWTGQLAGVCVNPVRICAKQGSRKVLETGPMLFTQDGIGGPAVLNLSRFLTDLLPNRSEPVKIRLDLIPSMSEGELDRHLIEACTVSPKKIIANLLADMFAKRLAATLGRVAGCTEDLQASQLTKQARKDLVKTLKALDLSVVATRPIAEATITRGGVDTPRIDPKTMESRICPGLFFAGEIIDVDGPCGGYNLQVCWSTGALAGRSVTI